MIRKLMISVGIASAVAAGTLAVRTPVAEAAPSQEIKLSELKMDGARLMDNEHPDGEYRVGEIVIHSVIRRAH